MRTFFLPVTCSSKSSMNGLYSSPSLDSAHMGSPSLILTLAAQAGQKGNPIQLAPADIKAILRARL
jgi:hypothetical protein